MPQFFDRYIELVPDVDLMQALEDNMEFSTEDISHFHALEDKTYAKDKWTVKDILQHLIDNERIQSYRALRFARKDKNLLPGYDEVLYGSTAMPQRRTVDDLVAEFKSLRQSTWYLFKTMPEGACHENGICFNVSISVLALGFVIVGHQIHHMNILKEKYFPLLETNQLK